MAKRIERRQGGLEKINNNNDLKRIPEMAVGFVSGEAIMSRLIRWWGRIEKTTARSNHAFLYLGKGKHLIAESIASGNKIRRLEKYLNKKHKVWIYAKQDLTVSQVQDIKDYLYETIGRKYDFRGVLRFIFKRIPQNPNKNYCSEWVIEMYRNAGIDLPIGSSPSALQDWIEKQSDWRLIFENNI